MSVTELQRKLKAAGCDPQGIDGEWGPLSQAAMDAYQRKNGVTPPLWLIFAERELGVHEVPGVKHNKRILEYHAATELKASSDEVPWCSSFANYCMRLAGVKGTNSAAAASWLKWGKATKFRYGCVVIFSREGGNHVAFGIAADDSSIAHLGGNQSDSVSVKISPRSLLRGMRWA